MNSAEIKHVLSTLGGRANKRLGQHFLVDDTALHAIIEAADIQPGERVLEIGPGLGVLTKELIEHGAEVVAIERDRRFVEFLSDLFLTPPTPLTLRGESESEPPLKTLPTGRQVRGGRGSYDSDRLQIIPGDAAQLDWDEIMGDGRWKFVANLPYSITSLAIRKALWAKNPPTKAVVLVQREVAERAIARDGKTSLLSLMVALASSSARIVKRVPAGAFFPPPKVESAILSIEPLTVAGRQKQWGIDPEAVMSFAKKGFAHPRKLLASNLGIDPSKLETVGLNPRARAEDLSPENWVSLAKTLDRGV